MHTPNLPKPMPSHQGHDVPNENSAGSGPDPARAQLLELLFETTGLGFVLVDDHGVVVDVNTAYVRLSGQPRSEIVGHPLSLLEDDSQPEAISTLRMALVTGEPATVVLRSDSRWLEVTLHPLPNHMQAHVAMLYRDVTAHHQAEQALAQSHRYEVLGRLAAGAAHDFNNVLSAIMAYTDFAIDGLEDAERIADLREVEQAAVQGSEITKKLLSFANYRGQITSDEPVDLAHTVRDIQPMLAHLAGSDTTIQITPNPELMFVQVAPEAIEQVLMNLVGQTCATVSSGSAIVISFERLPRISGHDLGRLSLSTRPVDKTGKPASACTRALAACRHLVEQFGGALETTYAIETGRVFHVDFPLTNTNPIAASHANQSPAPSTQVLGMRCLLVEDGTALREACARALSEAGFQVIEAPNAEVALREIDKLGPTLDLVICDMVLPGQSGNAVLHHVRSRCPEARFLAITGAVHSPMSHEGTEVLWKPFTPSALVRRAVDALFAGRSNTRPPMPTAQQERSGEANRDEAPPVQQTPNRTEPAPQPVGPTVLLVEDEESIRRGLSLYLTHRGFRVLQAGTGAHAIALHAENEVDLVVVDLHLPDMDGLTVLTAARDRDPLVPTLVLTGDPSVLTAQRALRAKVSAYLTKPIAPSDFVAEVDRSIKDGQVAKLQQKLLMSRVGDNADLLDLRETTRKFEEALDTLYMVYQPLVRAQDSSIFAFEALMRFESDSFRHPGELLSAADTLGRMEELGRRVRTLVAETIREHPERHELFFVNLHPMELRSELLLAEDEPLLPYASRVVLEVTERAQLASARNLPVVLESLQEAGYRVALDDLGEGYAGLSWLVKLTPDIAKLDMSLVRDIDKSRLKRELVASMVGVCRRARTVIVAEGVETAEEALVLRDLGCDLLQGYHFAKPARPFPSVAAAS